MSGRTKIYSLEGVNVTCNLCPFLVPKHLSKLDLPVCNHPERKRFFDPTYDSFNSIPHWCPLEDDPTEEE